MESRTLALNSFETTLVRTPSTPATVRVTAPAWQTIDVCVQESSVTFEGQCEEAIPYEFCYDDGDEHHCETRYNHAMTSCTTTTTQCIQSRTDTVLGQVDLTFKFRSPRKLHSGSKSYQLSIPRPPGSGSIQITDSSGESCIRPQGTFPKLRFVIKDGDC